MLNKCLYLRYRKKQGKIYCYCTKKRAIIESFECNGCIDKEYKKTAKNTLKIENKAYPKLKQKTPLNKVSKNNKVTKATAIPKEVKLKVWERDKHKCIICDTPVPWNCANSHFIKRSHLGLGIEENIFTACSICHHEFDDTTKRKCMLPIVKAHLKSKYDYWNEDILTYKKWRN